MATTPAAMTPSEQPTSADGEPHARPLAAAALGAYVLALAAARGVVHARGDVGFDDEIGYLTAGLHLASSGFPQASWSPLYAAWYWLLSLATTDTVALYHLSWAALVALNLGAVAALLRSGGASALGTVVALAVLSSLAVLTPPIASVSLLASAVFLAGVAAAMRAGGVRAGSARMVLAGAVGAFARPELGATAGVALVAYAVAAARSRPGWRSIARELAPAATAAAVLVAVLGNPLGGGRSFFAFSQHYAINAAQARQLPGDPWEEYRAITEKAFGDARTVRGALLANPGEFAWHLSRNAAHLGSLGAVLTPALDLGDRALRRLPILLWLVVAAGLALGVARLGRPGREGAAARVLGLGFAVAAVPSLGAMLLVQPEPSYALPPMLLLLAFAALGWATRGRSGGVLRRPAPALAAGAVLLAILPGPRAAPWWSASARAPRATPNLDLVRTLSALPVKASPPLQVLGYWGLGAFAGWSSRPVSYVACSPFAACVRERRVDVVVSDPVVAAYYARLGDRDFEAFRSAPASWGFVRPGTSGASRAEVYVRADRLLGPR